MPKKIENKDFEEYKPSKFMRARRPELFSDSKIISRPSLTKTLLEYHLDTLTNRKQENDFEHFCRLIAERELCPNLLPQTGPTGGGDSKVDAETYPVADSIALRWYGGIAREASSERWAFAFSAKKDWRSKVRSDVKGIIETDRDYKLIYFITNQFVRDKTRAEVEDDLKKTYNIEIRILDKNWLVSKVIGNNRINIAVETLRISGFDEKKDKIIGPRDAAGEKELKELEEQIGDTSRYRGVEYQLAEDCLRAALIARGLNLPRTEVEGRFLRAERTANKLGMHQQQLRIAYNRAWTTFWWYDDFLEFNALYDLVEKIAINSNQAMDIELLTNLWQLLKACSITGEIDSESAKISSRTKNLKSQLEYLASDDTRPSNALQAKTNRLLIALYESRDDESKLNEVLSKLKIIFETSEKLSEYPIESLANIIEELGEWLSEHTVYDDLFETVVNIMGKRKSEGEAGRLLMQRGYQKLGANKIYDAIRYFGRAQRKLAKQEYLHEFIAVSAGCGLAYECAGLLWAARANIIFAANRVMSEFVKHGEIIPQAFSCIRKLVWLELQLGRVPYALSWIEFEYAIANQLMLDCDSKEKFVNEFKNQDLVLGLLFLKTDIFELKWIDFLPTILHTLRLDNSWMALLYALGYEDHLQEEGIIAEDKNSDDVLNFFETWINQPAKDDLPNKPQLMESSKVIFNSYVLGCNIIAEVENNLYSICLAETILGALEALLATSLTSMVMPYRSDFRIKIGASAFVSKIPEHKIINDNGESLIEIRHPSTSTKGFINEQSEFRSWLLEIVVSIVSQIAITEDFESYFKQLDKQEAVFERALDFSGGPIALTNLLGEKPKFRISNWEPDSVEKRFNLKRVVPWHENIVKESAQDTSELRFPELGTGEPPSELFGIDNLKHPNRRVFSLINMPLWEKAEWQATAYLHIPDANVPPIMALGFKNEKASKAIFKEWQRKIGKIDKKEILRVSIIMGIDKCKPYSYSVIIGINPKISVKDSLNQIILVARINRMVPPDSKNLDLFVTYYKKVGAYLILPALYVDDHSLPTPFFELGILKTELRVCEAWKLQVNDLDICAISEDDAPIIPDGVKDPPIHKALDWFRSLRKRNKK